MIAPGAGAAHRARTPSFWVAGPRRAVVQAHPPQRHAATPGGHGAHLEHAPHGRARLAGKPHLAHDLAHRGREAALLEPALPHHQHRPARCRQLGAVARVAGAVARELGLPELDVALGLGKGAVRASMPEAPVHKHRDLAAGIGYVGLSGRRLPVQPIAWHARLAQGRTHPELRLGVLRLVRLHHVPSRLGYHMRPHSTRHRRCHRFAGGTTRTPPQSGYHQASQTPRRGHATDGHRRMRHHQGGAL